MRGDFSRFISGDSFNQYIGTFMQQGRVQLDADWNENVVNFLNMLWKQSRDFLGASACVGDSFRIGKDIPIDHMLQASVWNLGHPPDNYSPPDKRGYIFLNTNDRPRTNLNSANEKASLFVENANAIFREFNNLDLSRFKSIYVRFKVLEEEKKEEEVEDGEYANKNDNNYNSSSSNINQSSQSTPVLTLSVYTDKEENSNNNENKYEYEGQFIGLPDAGGFFKVKFDLLRPDAPTKTSLDKYDISRISKLSLHWDKIDDRAVCIGVISAEPMAVIVSADSDRSKSNPWANVTNSSSNSISITYKGKPTIMKEKGKIEMRWSFSRPMNFNSLNILRFAISRRNNDNSTSEDDTSSYSNPMLFLINSNDDTREFSLTAEQNKLSNDSWRSYSVNIEASKDESNDTKKVAAADDLNEIQSIGLKGLPENDVLYISEILGELNFENNFLISGDFDLNQSSRMYVNGILCSRDNWDSYLTQKDIPSAKGVDYFIVSSSSSSALSRSYDNSHRKQPERIKNAISYMVYADVWNRGITHLEDPEIREVALGGSDTSTRMQTICQIKLREIPDHLNFQRKIGLAEYEIKKMNEEGTGRLSIIYPHNSSLSNSESNFRTLGNHLYRIQIHDSGEGRMNNNDDNNRATFKWSKDNASLAFPIKKLSEKEVVLDQKGRRLDNVFQVDDFIEIINNPDELSEQPRGHMRRITDIRDGGKTLSWGTREDSEQVSVKYLHDPVTITDGRYHRPELCPKVILWDGIDYVNATMKDSSSYSLMSIDRSSSSDQGIRIRFDPGVFKSGHYWNFTTRSNGSVELLKSAKPMGPKHHYALLALIRKQIGEEKEIEIIEDLRHTYQPLTNLRAIDISYDDGDKLRSGAATTVQAAIQRLSGGRLRILPGHGNNGTINDLAIDAGEIYELKPVDGEQGTFASMIPFNDIYQHQPFLMYTIRSGNNSSSLSDVRHEIHMLAEDEDGNKFKDPVDDGTKNYAWRGFEIKADENAQVSWLAIGDSYTYFERFVKKVLDEILRVIFGVDTDELKEDSSILDAWYKKNLRHLSESGSDLERQAEEYWNTLQKRLDRWVRKADKRVENFEDFAKAFDFDEQKQEEEEEATEPPKPFAQMVNCPNCGQSYPKGKYTFCTKCSAKLPIE